MGKTIENSNLKRCIDDIIKIGNGSDFAIRYGTLDGYHDYFVGDEKEVDENTNFDMASVTKILSIGTLSLIALDENKLSLEDLVSKFFNCPKDKKNLTVRHLLIHTSGFAYQPLYTLDVNSDTVADIILNFRSECPPGTKVQYSCLAYILLGKILEKVYGKTLDVLFNEKVATPLGMKDTGFGKRKGYVVNANGTEELHGIVNDRNSRIIGGVAGNAGIFSNIADMTLFAKMLLSKGCPLIRQETFELATSNQTPEFSTARGLGFLYVDEKYKQTGNLFPVGSFGHCGHTGQSIFIDAEKGFFAIILSNMTLKSNGIYIRVQNSRESIHNAILDDINGIH